MPSRSRNTSRRTGPQFSCPDKPVLSDKCFALLHQAAAIIEAEDRKNGIKREQKRSMSKCKEVIIDKKEPFHIMAIGSSSDKIDSVITKPNRYAIECYGFSMKDGSQVEQKTDMEEPKKSRKRPNKMKDDKENDAPKRARRRAPRAPKQQKQEEEVEAQPEPVKEPINLDDDTDNVIDPTLMWGAYDGGKPEEIFNDVCFYNNDYGNNEYGGGYQVICYENEYNKYEEYCLEDL